MKLYYSGLSLRLVPCEGSSDRIKEIWKTSISYERELDEWHIHYRMLDTFYHNVHSNIPHCLELEYRTYGSEGETCVPPNIYVKGIIPVTDPDAKKDWRVEIRARAAKYQQKRDKLIALGSIAVVAFIAACLTYIF